MADDILHNSPALHALKRHQLVSLSKRYGLRATGKNTEMIERLKDHAGTLTPGRKLDIPYPMTTPRHALADFNIGPASPTSPSLWKTHDDSGLILDRELKRSSRASDSWEVLSDSNASLISPSRRIPGTYDSGSVSSWKSAGNGETLNEFGAGSDKAFSSRGKSSKSSSFKEFASNVSRRASLHLLSRSHSSGSGRDDTLLTTEVFEKPPVPAEPMEEVQDPPSPASTIGVPRRHSRISLLERPSTLRLCSPPPPEPSVDDDQDQLPFFDGSKLAAMKERRSMAPIRASRRTSSTMLNRKSLPALHQVNETSASVASIYPPLPTSIPPLPQMTGGPEGESQATENKSPVRPFLGLKPISNHEFEVAGKRVLAEMEEKIKANMGDRAPSFGQELLKGKKADIGILVRVNSTVGEGGFGLSSMTSGQDGDRYAVAHAREFDRMQSIGQMRNTSDGRRVVSGVTKRKASGPKTVLATIVPVTPGQKRKHSGDVSMLRSAPNGAPLIPADESGRETKRKRLSVGPNAMGSLREAGRSIANLIGEVQEQMGRPTPKRTLSKTPAKRRRSSVTSSKGRGLASRFGFLKTKRRVSLERGISSASLHRAAHNGGDTTVTAAPVVEGRAPKARKLSTSATSTLSTSSKIRPRPRLPEFGAPLPPVSKSGSAAGSINSTNALGLPRGGSVSSTSSSRKQSHSEAIRTARPAPAPPMEVIRDAQLEEAVNNMISTSTTTTSKRSSTLYMPTASSMARMQATIKPVVDRPLPKPPKIEVATAKPFGPGSSREETTFDTSFNVPKPRVPSNPSEGLKRSMTKSVTFNTNPTVAGSGNGLKSAPSFSAGGGRATPSGPRAPLRPAMRSPSKSPAKTSSISGKGARDRAGGISSIKSRGIDAEAAQKRAEVKARQERRAEERQLREILSYEA